jgi:tetratricopeptide (TPR) repeat protein
MHPMSPEPRRRLLAAAIALTTAASIATTGVEPAAAAPGTTAAAGAAQPAPSPAKRKAAKAYVDAGLAAQEQRDFDGAILLYQKAYDLVPHPALLFNMGQAHRLAGRRDDALAMYRRYLAEVSTGDLAGQARTWIADLERQAADEKQRAADAARRDAEAQAQARRDAEARAKARRDAEAQAQARRDADEQARRAKAPVTPAPPTSHPGRGYRIAGFTALGVGVAAIAVGGAFGAHARSLSDELSKPGAVYDPDKVDAGEAAERNMYIGYAAGAALVAGGATLLILHWRTGERATTVSVAPSVDPSRGALGVVAAGRF